MAQFTIGIPTYNRSHLLKEALASATPQLDGAVRVVVVNNGSTDATRAVLSKVPPNVTVIHHPENRGAHFSFKQTLEHSDTEFFSWLQDDDLLHRDFLCRAKNAFDMHPEASVYIAYAACTALRANIGDARLYGPPVVLSTFAGGGPQLIESSGLIALGFFCSVGIPPVVVFRRESLIKAMECWNPGFPLYAERSLLNSVLRDGPAVVDSFVGGIFYSHPGQEHKRLWKSDDTRRLDWLDMARKTSRHLAESPRWMDSAARLVAELPTSKVSEWLDLLGGPADAVDECHRLSQLMLARIQEENKEPAGKAPPSMKGCVRQLVPPLLWEVAAGAKRLARNYRSG